MNPSEFSNPVVPILLAVALGYLGYLALEYVTRSIRYKRKIQADHDRLLPRFSSAPKHIK